MFAAAPFSKPSERPDTNTGVKVEEIRIALGPKGRASSHMGCGHAGATDRVVALGPWPARKHIASGTGNFNFSFVGKTGRPLI